MFAFRDALSWWFDVFIYVYISNCFYSFQLHTLPLLAQKIRQRLYTQQAQALEHGYCCILRQQDGHWCDILGPCFREKTPIHTGTLTITYITPLFSLFQTSKHICKHDAVTAHECSLICPYTWKMTSETGTLRSLHPVGTIHWRPNLHGGNTQHERNSLSSLDFQLTKKMQISQDFWTRTHCVIRRPFESCRLSVFLGCHWDA